MAKLIEITDRFDEAHFINPDYIVHIVPFHFANHDDNSTYYAVRMQGEKDIDITDGEWERINSKLVDA